MATLHENNVIERLLLTIPEIKQAYQKEIEWWSDETPGLHNILGNIMNPFVTNLLRRSANNDALIKRIFTFYEDMAISNDEYVRNVLQVTLLEYLGDDKQILETALRYMGTNTKKLSDDIERHLGRKK